MRGIIVREKPIGGRLAPEVIRLQHFCERNSLECTIWNDGSDEALALKVLCARHFDKGKDSGVLPLFVLFEDTIMAKVVWPCYNPSLKVLREALQRIRASQEHPVV